MLWGSINENSAIVTYLNKFLAENKDDLVLRETGIWLLSDDKNQSWLGSSTDGIIDLNGKRERVLEMKCPFMGGKPIPYKNVYINHIPQIMLEMFCTSTQECQYVVWTSIGTKVFLVKRDDKYMELLINYFYKFWNLALNEVQPAWHEDVFGLKQQSKEIATKSPCISFISNSLTTPNVLSHGDLKKFETIDKPVQKKCISRKCQGCKDEEWRCKLDPCEVRRKRLNRSQGVVQQTSSQSYKYGSNGVAVIKTVSLK